MQIFKDCLLAADVDGTLVSNGKICPRNIQAIKMFKDQGGTFVLSTGRCAAALGQVFKLMDKSLVGPSIVLNGGMIFDVERQEVLYAKELTMTSKEYAHAVYEKLETVGIEVHSGADTYVIRKTDATEFHEDYEMLDREYVTFEQIKDKPWNKVLYVCDNEQDKEKLASLMTSLNNGETSFVCTRLAFDDILHIYYEQLPKDITKATGLKELARILKIKKGGVFAIGDYYNDVEMIQFADISATPCDSPDDIKQFADFVGGSCKDGAVADFIEYLFNTEVKK